MPRVDYGLLDDRFPYYRIGDGPRPLVVLPGLSDALQGAEPTRLVAELLARYYYRPYVDGHAVWVVGRPRGMPEGFSTRDMAAEYADALGGIGPASVLGLSMGGLVAQHLAVDYPARVERLVLGAAGYRLGDGGRETIARWEAWAERGEWREIYLDSVPHTYLGYRRWLYPPLFRAFGGAVLPEPANRSDVVVSCRACLDHDARGRLGGVGAPTLVVVGALDHFFPEAILRETAAAIPDARIALLGGAGHGAFEERKRRFDATVRRFLDADLD
ncbi:alpha/beta fold hydrolase [Halegenticoccus soli]|uniref:alpha/beta fold hydrolase n=1 Tax=Halegenticoccus soli TaxID=1985678 RepID=UPI000C6CBB3B|nr:alpha/beta fold hydrolase [Halegenticoccus soli]